jgi:hypothetical protein
MVLLSWHVDVRRRRPVACEVTRDTAYCSTDVDPDFNLDDDVDSGIMSDLGRERWWSLQLRFQIERCPVQAER